MERQVDFTSPGPIIAHRGASGRLPEHTLEAYAYAHGVGAHWLEPDVVRTRDGALLCLHDIVLERVTDVASVFPERKREDGSWYAIDFDLAELKGLAAVGPRGDGRGFQLCALEELLLLIARLDRATGRTTGVCPELKRPAFHRLEGRPLEASFLELMAKHGYTAPDAPALVQCFELDCLEALRGEHESRLPLLYLTEGEPLAQDQLRDLATKVQAVGPHRSAIEGKNGEPAGGAAWVAACHGAGLAVVPYTFDEEPEAMTRFLGTYGVDGLFTNYPECGVRIEKQLDR